MRVQCEQSRRAGIAKPACRDSKAWRFGQVMAARHRSFAEHAAWPRSVRPGRRHPGQSLPCTKGGRTVPNSGAGTLGHEIATIRPASVTLANFAEIPDPPRSWRDPVRGAASTRPSRCPRARAAHRATPSRARIRFAASKPGVRCRRRKRGTRSLVSWDAEVDGRGREERHRHVHRSARTKALRKQSRLLVIRRTQCVSADSISITGAAR